MRRTITVDEYEELCAALYQLTEILLAVGVVELKISKKEKEIFWDTENKGEIDPDKMYQFSEAVTRLAMDMERSKQLAEMHNLDGDVKSDGQANRL